MGKQTRALHVRRVTIRQHNAAEELNNHAEALNESQLKVAEKETEMDRMVESVPNPNGTHYGDTKDSPN